MAQMTEVYQKAPFSGVELGMKAFLKENRTPSGGSGFVHPLTWNGMGSSLTTDEVIPTPQTESPHCQITLDNTTSGFY